MIWKIALGILLGEAIKLILVTGLAYVWNWHRDRKARKLIKMSDELLKDLKKEG